MELPIDMPYDLLKIIKGYSGDPKYNKVVSQLDGIISSYKYENKFVEIKLNYNQYMCSGSFSLNSDFCKIEECKNQYINRFKSDVKELMKYDTPYIGLWIKHYFIPYKKKIIQKKSMSDFIKLKGMFRL